MYAGLLAAFVTVAIAAPAAAHEGEIGNGGPFRVEVTSNALPSGVELRIGNGELEMHVPSGTEIVALGVENEPFTRVDADGNMFGNRNSPTWWMGLDGGKGTPPVGLDFTADPDWEWVKAGGSMQYHDHRIHFMASSIDPRFTDGGEVFDFTLPFLVNGDGKAVSGVLVFDPALDPDGAKRLLAGTSPVATSPGAAPSTGSDSGSIIVIGAVAAAVLVLAGGAVVVFRRRL
jgi:LPXTG-motif cell wall-anchored protein